LGCGFVGKKEFNEINYILQDVQICLKCGSKNVTIKEDESKCKSCVDIISICESNDFV